MAIFKCKMCGGDLEINDGVTVAECEFCGTKQTLPKANDEGLQTLFNRANTLRMKSEFDKAAEIYEKILQKKDDEAEAYWGLILCKYGIEYVEDPSTFKRIPTCHRTSFDSIVADDDYKSAIEHADGVQRGIYEAEAREIDRIQKDILALSQKEEPYDVFICYKETDEAGQRTQDSVIANDIYYQLTQEGFKVFYAAITLEDKLGSAYEPCIFAALNSAKVMLALGTKPEYYNAVWVKNEWSRYLKMMKKDRSKMLIPCYKDMDAYELPEEFAHLQAQDMGKIGFINDIVRGIKKVIVKDGPKKETVIVNGAAANTAPLLKRAFMFLEDGDFASADEYCEKVLDMDPENGEAYLGKLMAELKVKKREALKDCKEPFDAGSNYQKALRFGDEALVNELNGYISHINERNENTRLNGIYSKALNIMKNASKPSVFLQAASEFESVSQYKDAAEKAKECREKAEELRLNNIYQNAINNMGSDKVSDLKVAERGFKSIPGYKDSDERAEKCHSKINQTIYDFSHRIFEGSVEKTPENWQAAQKGFESIPGWLDSDELAKQCSENAEICRKDRIYSNALVKMRDSDNTITNLEKAIILFKSISGWKDADDQVEACKKKIAEKETRKAAERVEEYKRLCDRATGVDRELYGRLAKEFEEYKDFGSSRKNIEECKRRETVLAAEEQNIVREHPHLRSEKELTAAINKKKEENKEKASRFKWRKFLIPGVFFAAIGFVTGLEGLTFYFEGYKAAKEKGTVMMIVGGTVLVLGLMILFAGLIMKKKRDKMLIPELNELENALKNKASLPKMEDYLKEKFGKEFTSLKE